MNLYSEFIHTVLLPKIFCNHSYTVQDTLQPRLNDAGYNLSFHVLPADVQAAQGVNHGYGKDADKITHNLHFRKAEDKGTPSFDTWLANRSYQRRDSYTISQLKELP